MSKIIGIDLGTTNSCAAVFEGSERVMIPNAEGSRTTPSIVAFTKDGRRLIGEAAKRQAVTNPERTIRSIKRSMGTDKRIRIDGKDFTPPEISAMILAQLKQDAENFLNEPVTEAVITVPAYFTDAQRQATKDAGTIAGLNVQRIINEPTSAALAYGIDKEQAQHIMVYDLGGGTFDVSILDINQGVIQVMATSGNNMLGGDDFDACITQWLLKEFKKKEHCDLSRDPMAMQRLQEASEKAKIDLSSSPTADINLPFIVNDKSGPKHLQMTLSKTEFDQMTKYLVDETMEPVQRAVQDSGLSVSQIDKVLMVGGSSRIPAVYEAIKSYVGKEPFRGINPDECVAMGACLQGGVLAGAVHGLLLLDVTPLSLGIETVGGVCTRLIDRNTTLPITKSQIFSTASNYQTSVVISVLQGERQMAKQNKCLGKFTLKGIRRAPAGVPQIEVTFEIDTNGIVKVSAKDLDTQRFQDITISGSNNMSQQDIDQAIQDAQRFAAQDAAARDNLASVEKLNQLLYKAENSKKSLPRDKKKELDEAMKFGKQALKKKNYEDVSQAVTRLEALLGQQ